VYPANQTTGKINIFDVVNLQDVNIVNAHKMPITCLTLNYEGNKLATASEKVTPPQSHFSFPPSQIFALTFSFQFPPC